MRDSSFLKPQKQVTTPKTALITFLLVIGVWYLTDNHKSSITFPCLNQSQPHCFNYWISFIGSKKNTAERQISAFLKQKNSAFLSPTFFICCLVHFLKSFFVFLPETWTVCKEMLRYTPVWLLSYDLCDLWDRKTWWSVQRGGGTLVFMFVLNQQQVVKPSLCFLQRERSNSTWNDASRLAKIKAHLYVPEWEQSLFFLPKQMSWE